MGTFAVNSCGMGSPGFNVGTLLDSEPIVTPFGWKDRLMLNSFTEKTATVIRPILMQEIPFGIVLSACERGVIVSRFTTSAFVKRWAGVTFIFVGLFISRTVRTVMTKVQMGCCALFFNGMAARRQDLLSSGS